MGKSAAKPRDAYAFSVVQAPCGNSLRATWDWEAQRIIVPSIFIQTALREARPTDNANLGTLPEPYPGGSGTESFRQILLASTLPISA
jgi:hypothetical protein